MSMKEFSLEAISTTGGDHIENSDKVSKADNDGEDEEYTVKEQRKIIHKIDRRLLVILGAMQAVSFLDRANMSNANIAGMAKALHLAVGKRYSVVLLVFFGPYILLQIPSNRLLRKIGPRVFMSSTVVAWGIVMMCFGFVQSWRSLIPLRLLLGALESGALSGQFYLISCWYARYDLHKRVSTFYLIAVLGSAFGGVLGLLFSQMGGLGGEAAWRWIFIMEGLLTIIIGVLGYAFMINFPEESHKAWGFLSVKEKDFVIRHINRDRADAETPNFSWKRLFSAALDWKIWSFGLLFFCSTIQAYSVGFYLPLILEGEMGFSVAAAQALSSPPYLAAMALMFVEGYICDKVRLRGPCLVFNALLSATGLCMMTWTTSSGSQYVGSLFVTAGCSANIPAVMVYQANNIRGHWKRAFCNASLSSLGGIGGIAGSLVFRSEDAPDYVPGITACLVANGLTLLLVGLMTIFFYVRNHQAARGDFILENLPGFRYTY
ncbi:hypothetical protein LTS17_006558 [Exophiala oligosperma]